MKRILALTIVLILSQNINAQYFIMGKPLLKPCSIDSSILTMQLENWEIYQTENDIWNGLRLESCIKVTQNNYEQYLHLEGLEVNKPFFFRSLLAPNNEEILQKNQLYSVYSGGYSSDCNVDLERNCGQNICTGVILGIKIPTESGLSDTTRYHELQYDQYFSMNTCIPSEYFDNQSVNEAIIKITLDSISPELDSIRMPVRYLNLEHVYDQQTFDQLDVSNGYLYNSIFEINIEDAVDNNNYVQSFLGLHNDELYPKTGNNTYIDIELDLEITEQALIKIFVKEYMSLSFQPYTELRSPFISGSDSIRHKVEIVQEGADMCIGSVELTYGPSTSHRYKSGHISLASQNACLKFLSGSKLIIDNANMIYGDDNAVGMIAFLSGSEIRFEGKSSLTFKNTMAILPTKNIGKEYIDIYLKHEQSLLFEKGSDLRIFGNPYIRVHMLGGNLDISNLSKSDQQQFILIYPTPKINTVDNLQIFPNPTTDYIKYSYHSPINQQVKWSITDLSGKTILKGNNLIVKGFNDIIIDKLINKSGIYIFHITFKNSHYSKKIIKL